MLFSRLAPRWTPRNRVSTLSDTQKNPDPVTVPDPDPVPDPVPDPTPAPTTNFIPKDADWWFDRTLLSNSTITTWNNSARSNSREGGTATVVDLTAHGMPGKLSLKNSAVQPRCVASGQYKGAIRAMRRPTAGTDPTGGPNDTADWQTMNPAHNRARPVKPNGAFWTIPYGQRFELGFKFMVPAPNDSDLAGFIPSSCNWIFGLSLSTTSSPSTSAFTAVLTYYGEKRIFCKSAYADTNEINLFHGPGGTTGIPPKPSWGIVWNPNQWYAVRMIGVVDNASKKRGWCDFYIDDLSAPFVKARNVQCGKASDSEVKTVDIGQYSTWGLNNQRRCIYYDQFYLKLGATGYPSPPA